MEILEHLNQSSPTPALVPALLSPVTTEPHRVGFSFPTGCQSSKEGWNQGGKDGGRGERSSPVEDGQAGLGSWLSVCGGRKRGVGAPVLASAPRLKHPGFLSARGALQY